VVEPPARRRQERPAGDRHQEGGPVSDRARRAQPGAAAGHRRDRHRAAARGAGHGRHPVTRTT
jgi:hypothetical protein